jgi:hypothetical protein
MKIKKNIFCFCFLFFVFVFLFFVFVFLFFVFVFCCFIHFLFCFWNIWFWFYGVALHLNSFSSSSGSESVVQSFDEESVVHSDEFSNKRLDTLESVDGSDVVGKGDAGKYGVETMLMVASPLMSQIGEKASGNILVYCNGITNPFN